MKRVAELMGVSRSQLTVRLEEAASARSHYAKTAFYGSRLTARDGQIISIRPNLRWTSDGFEIACWNNQVGRVAFAQDTCDRKVMAWCASTFGISAEMIRDMMLESMERRFSASHTSAPVQWLSDNGSGYRAHQTIDFTMGLGLVPCVTPVRSPQSNGTA